MLRSGMMYVRTYCNDYFRRMAIEQRESRIIRDSLAPLSALIIGLAGIRDFSSNEASEDDVIALLGLLTATSASALDVYDKHLLFGAENIDSVRTLTMKALETHKQAILEEQGYGFEDAIELLLEHQNICSPQAILALTRKAIQAAEPEPDEDGAPAAAAPAAAAAAAAPAAPARPAGSPPRVPIGIKIKQQ